MQTVLITGASSGIGKALAELLLENGYTVYAAARRVEKMQDLKEQGANVLAMDVTDESSMRDGVRTILQDEKKIDVLVNNAGYGAHGAMEDVDLAEAKRQFEVNVFGLMRLTQLVLPAMREQKSGRILNVSSMGGRLTLPYGGWYHGAKYAVEAVSDALRMEVKPFGIKVVIIEPGPIYTEWQDIAHDNLIRSAAGGPYEQDAKRVAAGMQRFYQYPTPSTQKVARVMYKAIRSARPRFRYAIGIIAKAGIFSKRVMPQRWFDAVIRAALK